MNKEQINSVLTAWFCRNAMSALDHLSAQQMLALADQVSVIVKSSK